LHPIAPAVKLDPDHEEPLVRAAHRYCATVRTSDVGRLVADGRPHAATGGYGRLEIPADGFRIEPELGGDPLLRQALAAEPKDFPDFNHGDLAIHPRLLAPERRPEVGDLYRAGQAKGGEGFEKLAPQGGVEKPQPRGGKGSEKVVRKGSLGFQNRHNHPNGNLTASEQDKVLTRAIVLAAESVGLKILDHVIVTASGTFSFRTVDLL
jgi:hypothetical protein